MSPKSFIVLLVFGALVVAVALFVFVWSVSPTAALILIGVCIAVGVPVVAGVVLLVLIAGCGSDWSTCHDWIDWSNVAPINKRWDNDR